MSSGTKVQKPFTLALCDKPVPGLGAEWREFARVTVDGEITMRGDKGLPKAIKVKYGNRTHTITLQNANQAVHGCRGLHGVSFGETEGGKLVIQLQSSDPPRTDEKKRERAAGYVDALLIAAGIIGAKKWMFNTDDGVPSGLPHRALAKRMQ